MTKHIVLICNEYPPYAHGGIGVFVKNLANNLVQEGFECTVMGIYNISETIIDYDIGVKIIRISELKNRFWNINVYTKTVKNVLNKLKLSLYLRKYEKVEQVDVIESYEWNGPLILKPISKLVVRLHGSNTAHAEYERKDVHKMLKFYEKLNLNFADEVVSVSKHMMDITENTFGIINCPKQVIYNSYNNTLFNLNPSIKRDPNKILFVGKFHERKGVYELFDILNQIFKLDEAVHFQFVGSHTENNRKELLNKVDVAHTKRITFTNAIHQFELPAIYNTSSLMIMPSRAEAFGLTAIEAMACGCVVAISDLPVAKEILENDVDGLIIDITRPQESALKIFSLLRDFNKLERMRNSAIEKVLNKFSNVHILKQNINLYNTISSDH